MSINRMDSLVEIFLKDKDISNNHYINIIDIKNDTIIKSTSENQADLDDRLNSKIIPIKTNTATTKNINTTAFVLSSDFMVIAYLPLYSFIYDNINIPYAY